MPDSEHGSPDRPVEPVPMSAAEKLACEWEARHDVAARGRQVDPAAALQRYLSHVHADDVAHPAPHHEHARRERTEAERFAAEHPMAASWVRWGEDRH